MRTFFICKDQVEPRMLPLQARYRICMGIRFSLRHRSVSVGYSIVAHFCHGRTFSVSLHFVVKSVYRVVREKCVMFVMSVEIVHVFECCEDFASALYAAHRPSPKRDGPVGVLASRCLKSCYSPNFASIHSRNTVRDDCVCPNRDLY